MKKIGSIKAVPASSGMFQVSNRPTPKISDEMREKIRRVDEARAKMAVLAQFIYLG